MTRRDFDEVFGHTLSNNEKRALATLIYYPKKKMELKVTSSSTSRTLDFLHFLSRQSLSYFCIMTIDSMVFLHWN